MALNKLVGGDCGGNNTLVQLSSIVGRDASAGRASTSQADRFVSEFLAQNTQQPQTFNMNTLLGSVRDIDKAQAQKHHSAQFFPQLTKSYMPALPPSGYEPMFPHPMMYHQSHRPPSNVQIQYVNDSELIGRTSAQDELRAKAQEVVDAVKDDDEVSYNQFIDFMKNITSGGVDFTVPTEQEQTRKISQEEMLHQMEEKYRDEWERLSNVPAGWQDEQAYGIPKEYSFADGNVMLENKNALEIGKEKLKMGDVPGAVLCFEAAVKQQPDSAEAWFLLGTTQAENEQDPLAIAALRKTLELDPRRSEAYMTLAAAYTNENLAKLAFLSLHDWLRATPQYADLMPRDVDPHMMDNKQLESHIKSLYIQAAQLNPAVDPDVQNALGVLFNITQEYDKAVDCFRTALMVSSDNSKLWNRLGATLANSERSEEAVDAYHEALNLEPGFIRARYNVGITCMNLGAYHQAAEHFLVALNQQDKARGIHPEANATDSSSSTIWSTLRMVCAFMGEQGITAFVDDRNLTELNRFFEIQ